MRDIKFRGKNNGKWVYGSLFERTISEGFYIAFENAARSITELQVDPETVGQYTGFKDSNDVEFFEGDIFRRVDTRDTYKVIWKNDCFLASHIYDAWLRKDISQREDNVSLHLMTTFKLEIIRNIHN